MNPTGIEVTAFPLSWPIGTPRTAFDMRKLPPFRVTFAVALNGLLAELRSLGAKGIVVSTNLPLRRDGLPYAGQAEPADMGVATYFELGGKHMAMACDRWIQVRSNIRALELTVNAMRGIARWGSTDAVQRAFSGFQALPPPATGWRATLGVGAGAGLAEAKAAYRAKIFEAHPDRNGGDNERASMLSTILNTAMQAAEKEFGG